jgi:hypothetical protein
MRVLSIGVGLIFLIASSAHAGSCMDLSGNWEGTCTPAVGTTFTYKVEFEQIGCETILSRGAGEPVQLTHIGGPSSYSLTTGDKTRNFMAQINWSADGQTLEWTSATLISSPKEGKVSSELGNGTETIVNDIYHLKSDFAFRKRVNGVESKSENSYDCQFARVVHTSPATQALSKQSPYWYNQKED